jgi:hypothetical protein
MIIELVACVKKALDLVTDVPSPNAGFISSEVL